MTKDTYTLNGIAVQVLHIFQDAMGIAAQISFDDGTEDTVPYSALTLR